MRGLVLIFAAAMLAGCASTQQEKPPVCDGKHRRPANLYGSVLDPATPPSAAPTAPPADKRSALPPTFASCRA